MQEDNHHCVCVCVCVCVRVRVCVNLQGLTLEFIAGDEVSTVRNGNRNVSTQITNIHDDR